MSASESKRNVLKKSIVNLTKAKNNAQTNHAQHVGYMFGTNNKNANNNMKQIEKMFCFVFKSLHRQDQARFWSQT